MDIWIIEQVQPCNLFDDMSRGRFILTDGDYKPLLDAQGQPYRYTSIARAEGISFEWLRPSLLRLIGSM